MSPTRSTHQGGGEKLRGRRIAVGVDVEIDELAFAQGAGEVDFLTVPAGGVEQVPEVALGEAIEQLWRSFADLGQIEDDALDVADLDPEEVADLVDRRLQAGFLTV